MNIEFSYGEGQYLENQRSFSGQIILGKNKLYIKGPGGDFPQTYIPVERIARIKLASEKLELFVRLTPVTDYSAIIAGKKNHITELASDLVKRLNLKKRFFKKEWSGDPVWQS